MSESRRQSSINAFVSSEQSAVVAPKKREKAAEPENEEEMRPRKSQDRPAKPAEDKKSGKSDLEKLIKANSRQHGVQKCVYFDSDVMEYLEKLSKTNNINFSKLVNLIIRSSM